MRWALSTKRLSFIYFVKSNNYSMNNMNEFPSNQMNSNQYGFTRCLVYLPSFCNCMDFWKDFANNVMQRVSLNQNANNTALKVFSLSQRIRYMIFLIKLWHDKSVHFDNWFEGKQKNLVAPRLSCWEVMIPLRPQKNKKKKGMDIF